MMRAPPDESRRTRELLSMTLLARRTSDGARTMPRCVFGWGDTAAPPGLPRHRRRLAVTRTQGRRRPPLPNCPLHSEEHRTHPNTWHVVRHPRPSEDTKYVHTYAVTPVHTYMRQYYLIFCADRRPWATTHVCARPARWRPRVAPRG